MRPPRMALNNLTTRNSLVVLANLNILNIGNMAKISMKLFLIKNHFRGANITLKANSIIKYNVNIRSTQLNRDICVR